MIKNFIMRTKGNYDYIQRYCREAQEEIQKSNFKMVYTLSITTSFLILVFISMTPFIIPGWVISAPYAIFLVAMVLFTAYSQICKNYGMTTGRMEKILHCGYMILVSTFLIVLDTVAVRESSQAFVGVFIAVAPIIFIVSVREALAYQAYLLFVFLGMAFHFKDEMIARGDFFNLLFGFVVGWILYVTMAHLRAHDYFQKSAYKISSELDPLTGLANRTTASSQIDHYLENRREGTSCAMIVLDVDDFKLVNDKLGHTSGDEVLRNMAKILKHVFRGGDVVSRFGGDEFLVFMEDIYDNDIVDVKCREIIQRMKEVLEGKFNISCSMGVCVLTHTEATSLEEMFRIADEALYEAKVFGKGNYVKHKFEKRRALLDDLPLMVIVDDNLVDRETIAIQFETNYRIKKFENSEHAIQYIEQRAKEISIILLDMIMPGKDGFEVLRIIKSKPETGWIPVIAISSDAAAEEKALAYGAADMIAKPIIPAVARLRVANVMEKTKVAE